MSEVLQFNISVPFAPTGAAPVDVMRQDPPTGAYAVTITSAKQVTSDGEGGSGKTSLHVGVSITEEGPAKGIQSLIVLGTDFAKPFNVGHFGNLLLGMGAKSDKLKGPVNITPEKLIGKTAYVFVKAPPEGELDDAGRRPFANKNFITKEMYESAKASQQIAAGQPAAPRTVTTPPKTQTNGAAAQAPAQQQTPPPAPPAAGGAPLDDLFN